MALNYLKSHFVRVKSWKYTHTGSVLHPTASHRTVTEAVVVLTGLRFRFSAEQARKVSTGRQ